MRRTAAFERIDGVANGEQRHVAPRVYRRAADVRRQNCVGQLEQERLDLRLAFEDVEAGGGDDAVAKRPGERPRR